MFKHNFRVHLFWETSPDTGGVRQNLQGSKTTQSSAGFHRLPGKISAKWRSVWKLHSAAMVGSQAWILAWADGMGWSTTERLELFGLSAGLQDLCLVIQGGWTGTRKPTHPCCSWSLHQWGRGLQDRVSKHRICEFRMALFLRRLMLRERRLKSTPAYLGVYSASLSIYVYRSLFGGKSQKLGKLGYGRYPRIPPQHWPMPEGFCPMWCTRGPNEHMKSMASTKLDCITLFRESPASMMDVLIPFRS